MSIPCKEISHITAERLERRVRLGGPDGRHFPDNHTVKHILQLSGHHHQTLHGLLDVLEGATDHGREPVEPDQLLPQHRVHRLLVHHREHLHYHLQVEVRWEFRQNIGRQLIDNHLRGFPLAAGLPGKREQDAFKQVLRLLVVLGDVRVLVQPEDLGVGDDGQGADVLDVGGVVAMCGGVVGTTGRKPASTSKLL